MQHHSDGLDNKHHYSTLLYTCNGLYTDTFTVHCCTPAPQWRTIYIARHRHHYSTMLYTCNFHLTLRNTYSLEHRNPIQRENIIQRWSVRTGRNKLYTHSTFDYERNKRLQSDGTPNTLAPFLSSNSESKGTPEHLGALSVFYLPSAVVAHLT